MASVWDKNNNRPKGRPVKVPRESDTQARIRAYCLSVGIDNRCVVRQATEDERREYNIIG